MRVNPMQSNPLCNCISQLEQKCRTGDIPFFAYGHENHTSEDQRRHDSEFGRMIYTCSILLMFAGIIILLMIRSIKRSKSSIEVETLLDAMRYREELDLQQRQKRKLQKAKNKISAWLTKNNNNKMWSSSPQIMISSNRTNSLQSSGSFIPEIVISNTDEFHHPRRMDSYTPSLSLIYDFDASRKNSILSDLSGLSGHSAGSDCFQVISENNHNHNHRFSETATCTEDDAVIRAAARQRSASRADTGESAKSAPVAALTAAYKVRSRDNSLKMKHSSTSSLSPHRHKLQHEITIDVP